MKSIQSNAPIEKPILPRGTSRDSAWLEKGKLCRRENIDDCLGKIHNATSTIQAIVSRKNQENAIEQIKSQKAINHCDKVFSQCVYEGIFGEGSGVEYDINKVLSKYKQIAELLPNNQTVQAKFELIKELNDKKLRSCAAPLRQHSCDIRDIKEQEYNRWRRSDQFKKDIHNIVEKIDIVDQMPLEKNVRELYRRPAQYFEYNGKYKHLCGIGNDIKQVEQIYKDEVIFYDSVENQYLRYDEFNKKSKEQLDKTVNKIIEEKKKSK